MVAWRWWWGNSTYYARIGRLPNTQNDAADISATLRRLGFEVTTELDADRVEMTDALRTFTRRSARRDVSLVFYAGHGIEMDGVNYLVGRRAPGARRRRALRDGDAGRPVGVDRGRIATVGDPGRVPEQPAGALDAAHGRERIPRSGGIAARRTRGTRGHRSNSIVFGESGD